MRTKSKTIHQKNDDLLTIPNYENLKFFDSDMNLNFYYTIFYQHSQLKLSKISGDRDFLYKTYHLK